MRARAPNEPADDGDFRNGLHAALPAVEQCGPRDEVRLGGVTEDGERGRGASHHAVQVRQRQLERRALERDGVDQRAQGFEVVVRERRVRVQWVVGCTGARVSGARPSGGAGKTHGTAAAR